MSSALSHVNPSITLNSIRPQQREIYTHRVSSRNFCLPTSKPNLCHQHQPSTIMAEIKIDKNLFQERLSRFVSAWKTDKRSGDALFNGASSIVVLMGKTEDTAQYQKNNAIHVRWNDCALLYDMETDLQRSFGCLVTNFLLPYSFSHSTASTSSQPQRKVRHPPGYMGNLASMADII